MGAREEGSLLAITSLIDSRFPLYVRPFPAAARHPTPLPECPPPPPPPPPPQGTDARSGTRLPDSPPPPRPHARRWARPRGSGTRRWARPTRPPARPPEAPGHTPRHSGLW